MHSELVRRLAAEVVGTALLVLFGAGSVVATLTVNKGQSTTPAWGSSPWPSASSSRW